MNGANLPHDPARWPTDPYELLGVGPGVCVRDLKRAYTRLIRQFKPEQAPEKFGLIRKAYEDLLHIAEWTERYAVRNPLVPESGDKSGEPAQSADVAAERTPLLRAVDDPAETAWESAVAGDLPGAYAALVNLHRADPDRHDLPLRLYWLLLLQPDLDVDRPAVSWLVTALSRSHLSGPAMELYRRELLECPAAALAAGDCLLDGPAPAARLVDLADARLRASGRIRRWPPDLDRLRERLSVEDEEGWLRLQFTAADGLVWWYWPHAFSDLSLLSAREAEIRRHGHLGLRLGYLFDRHDLLTAAAAGWRKLAEADLALPTELFALFPPGWNGPFTAVRPVLVRVIERIAAAPLDWLRHFDAIQRSCPLLLTLFANMLEDYQDRLPEPPMSPHSTEVLRKLTADFFDEAGLVPYKSLRPGLLDFCLTEAVGPEWLADVAPVRPRDWPSRKASLAETLRNDWPLRLVCWAVRLFWA